METSQRSLVAEYLLEAVPRLMQTISAEAQSSGPESGLTPTQLRVIGLLVGGRRLPSELARSLRISPATTSEVVELLTRRGLVERRDNPGDRRVSVLAATQAGSEAWRGARSRALAALEAVVDQLSPPEARSLEEGIRGVLEVMAPGATARREEEDVG